MTDPATEVKMRCIAVDDEPFALKLIADDISKVSFLNLVTTCPSASKAQKIVSTENIDLIFLDIQMPVLTGTQFIRSLEKPPLVILTTAFEKYALEGFELDVIDYLVKPIPFDRFLKAVNKAHAQFLLKSDTNHPSGKNSFLFVHSEYKEIKVKCDDILYIEGLKDYVKIFLASQPRPVLTRLNLKAIESKLPDLKFCRVHNSFIVSLSQISSSQKSQIFIGKTSIPVGEKYASAFRTKYGVI